MLLREICSVSQAGDASIKYLFIFYISWNTTHRIKKSLDDAE